MSAGRRHACRLVGDAATLGLKRARQNRSDYRDENQRAAEERENCENEGNEDRDERQADGHEIKASVFVPGRGDGRNDQRRDTQDEGEPSDVNEKIPISVLPQHERHHSERKRKNSHHDPYEAESQFAHASNLNQLIPRGRDNGHVFRLVTNQAAGT